MAPYDVNHRDPHPLARSAAVRSATEQDPLTREHARKMTIAVRLRTGFELSRLASRLRAARP
jgi:hypothetical protein